MLVSAPPSLSWSHYYFYNSIMMCFTSIVILSVVSHTITTFAIPIPSDDSGQTDPTLKEQGLYSFTTQLSYAVADDNVTVFSSRY